MIPGFRLTVVLVMTWLVAAGCTRTQPRATQNQAESYSGTLHAAEKRAEAGDYVGADKILADFAVKAKGTPEGTEVSFWRAMYMLDPANRTSSLSEGIRALEIYLATPTAIWYRAPAQVLRRNALTVQSLRAANLTPRVIGRDTVYVSREDEVESLREQLARANAELDRIKKRLATPTR